MKNLSAEQISKVIKRYIRQKRLKTEDTSIIFYDLSFLEKRIEKIIYLFPIDSIHAAAIKANPLFNVLRFIKKFNIGFETASLPELYIAKSTGIPSKKIFFDSPAKTNDEIIFAIKNQININADSITELKRIKNILGNKKYNGVIGLRINPQVGAGKIAVTGVADTYSKFGVPIQNKKEIVDAYLKYNWLNGIHLHIGSQGISIKLLIKGIRKVLNLAEEINLQLEQKNIKKRIKYFDIGGGFPVSYFENRKPIEIEKFVKILKTECNHLFTKDFKIITEFGRYVFANSGWVLTRIEYVKNESNYNTIITHLGADMFLRKIYNPGNWHHDIFVVNQNGNLKKSKKRVKYNIAGPLCFAGDFLGNNILLPEVFSGDYLVIKDSGAYTLSMWSRYNSRQIPKVIGYTENGNNFKLLKKRESPEDLLNFWR